MYLPKIGWVRFRNSRPVEGKIQQATIKRDGNSWFVCLSCEIGIQDPVHPSNSAVGIDVGVVSFASLSDGTQIKPLSSFRNHEARLALAQRKLSLKPNPQSRNFRKLKAKVRQLHLRILEHPDRPRVYIYLAGKPSLRLRKAFSKAILARAGIDGGAS